MKELQYEFTDLDENQSLGRCGKAFGGVAKNHTLFFDNEYGKGWLTKLNPQSGLWMRNWNLTVQQNINLHKLPATEMEKKFCLVYLFDPSAISVKSDSRKVSTNARRNNLFFSNQVSLSFSILPKQPFSVIDLTFSVSWLLQEFENDGESIRQMLDGLVSTKTGLMVQPCSVAEYMTLHELKVCLFRGEYNPVFIRSMVYRLIGDFLNKMMKETKGKAPCCTLRSDQVLLIERLFMENLNNPPSIPAIAKVVNMSVPSLLRQFKLMFGKGIYEYFLERKMELAKKMIMRQKVPIKKLSVMFGYKRPSPFIETFTKHHGFSPGSLKR